MSPNLHDSYESAASLPFMLHTKAVEPSLSSLELMKKANGKALCCQNV